MPIVLDSEILKQLDTPEIVSLSFVSEYCNDHPERVKVLLAKHEEKASADPSVNLLKIGALSGVRERYFDEDFINSASEAYNFAPGAITAAMTVVKGLFGKKTDAVTGAVTNKPGTAVIGIMKDKMKGLLTKIFNKKDGDGDLNGDNAQELAAVARGANPDDPLPAKKILGMKPGLFWGVLIAFVLLIVILVIFAVRKKKKTAAVPA